MRKFLTFAQSRSNVTHFLAVGIAGFIAAYNDVPQFAQFCHQLYQLEPRILQQATLAGIALYLFYRNDRPSPPPPLAPAQPTLALVTPIPIG